MQRSWELMERDVARLDRLVDFLRIRLDTRHPVAINTLAEDLTSDEGLEALGFVGEWGYGYISDSAEGGFNETPSLDDAIYGAQRKPEITGDKVIRRWYRREYFDADEKEIKKARDNRRRQIEALRVREERRKSIEREYAAASAAIEAEYAAKLEELP